jgi:thiol:disulfide interchange protein DsbG
MKRWIEGLICAAVLSVLAASPALAADQPKWLDATTATRLQEANAIVEGASGAAIKSKVYVFMDPNCHFCHLAWKALQPYEAVGLQVHWIPVAFLKPDSAGKAASLLQSENGAALLKAGITGGKGGGEQVDIAPLEPIPAAVQAKIDRNMQVFQQLGYRGTPVILYQGSGGRWADVHGLPRLGMLPGMLGLPEQPITDAELQKYR